MNKFLASLLLVACPVVISCSTTNGQHGSPAIEQMSEVEYNKWKLYIQLGVKIGANRLLQEQVVSEDTLNATATVLETVRDQTVVPGANAFLTNALKDSGLNNDEVQLLLLVVEQELIERGALDWIDPNTGLVALSPRTKDVLTLVADALRSALIVTENEMRQYNQQ